MRQFILAGTTALLGTGLVAALFSSDVIAEKPAQVGQSAEEQIAPAAPAAPVRAKQDSAQNAMINVIAEIRRDIDDNIFAGTSLAQPANSHLAPSSPHSFRGSLELVVEKSPTFRRIASGSAQSGGLQANGDRRIGGISEGDGIGRSSKHESMRLFTGHESDRTDLTILFDAAYKLEARAHRLDLIREYRRADRLRRLARQIREEARQP